MTDIEAVTLKAELVDARAERSIAKAVKGRQSAARKYVMRLRRQHPDATPAEIIRLLERHYATSISTAGAVIAAGTIAADFAISLMVEAGSAVAERNGSEQKTNKAGKEAAKTAAKIAAKAGARQIMTLIPMGDARVQFELTAIFGLAIADIHDMRLDEDQSRALVYGLSNGRVSQQQIATMAADLANGSLDATNSVRRGIASGDADLAHWAVTLAESLPAGAAQSLLRTIRTGQIDTSRVNLNGKQKAAFEYGVGALAGGIGRFMFGRDVINASRRAFAVAPDSFPAHLTLATREVPDEEKQPSRSSRGRAVLEGAVKSTGAKVAATANAVGGGVSTTAIAVGSRVSSAADTASRALRKKPAIEAADATATHAAGRSKPTNRN